jgi:hypothetical protein
LLRHGPTIVFAPDSMRDGWRKMIVAARISTEPARMLRALDLRSHRSLYRSWRTSDEAVPRPPTCTSVLMLETRPKPATLCHFSSDRARLRGHKAHPVSRFRTTGFDVRCGFLGDQETPWHERPPPMPLFLPSAVHYLGCPSGSQGLREWNHAPARRDWHPDADF